MIVAETNLFNNNSIYVYFFSCIVILSYQHFSKCQRISLIYATTIAMEIFSQYSVLLTVVMLLISMFILEEYLSDDKVKCELLSNFRDKIVDFIYQFIFIDAGLCIAINIVASGVWFKSFILNRGIPMVMFYGINVFGLLITIHLLNTSKFELCDFGTIKSYFDKFDGKKIKWDSNELQRRFNVMVALEDKSYFERTKSYNWFSVEFIKYKIKEYKINKEKKTLRQKLQFAWTQVKKFRLFRETIKKIRCKIIESAWTIKDPFQRLERKIRGCSTIEMQLIRNIGIKKGYNKCIVKRKAFEFIYTDLFFSGLKKYYENTLNNKRKEFKKFILYVYLHSIRLSLDKNDFTSINKLFVQEQVEEWDIDEFYVAILSLTGAPVKPKRMALYPHAVSQIGIDLNRALAWRNMIKDFLVTETNRIDFIESKVKKVFYVIRGEIIPYVEDGKFYGPNDGPNDREKDWPSYGENKCWSFAQSVYRHIWRKSFSSEAGTEDDMMRVCCSLDERTITPEHCQIYLGVAEPGAVIRICDDIKGNDSRGGINIPRFY